MDGFILFIIALINTKLEDLVKLAEVFWLCWSCVNNPIPIPRGWVWSEEFCDRGGCYLLRPIRQKTYMHWYHLMQSWKKNPASYIIYVLAVQWPSKLQLEVHVHHSLHITIPPCSSICLTQNLIVADDAGWYDKSPGGFLSSNVTASCAALRTYMHNITNKHN